MAIGSAVFVQFILLLNLILQLFRLHLQHLVFLMVIFFRVYNLLYLFAPQIFIKRLTSCHSWTLQVFMALYSLYFLNGLQFGPDCFRSFHFFGSLQVLKPNLSFIVLYLFILLYSNLLLNSTLDLPPFLLIDFRLIHLQFDIKSFMSLLHLLYSMFSVL